MHTAILIPVLNEEAALPHVLAGIPAGFRVVVCDNGSTDGSIEAARAAGAEVVFWPARGYGGAVLAGLKSLAAHPPECVVVLDGDHSFYAEDLPLLLTPIAEGRADFVLGERASQAEAGAVFPHQAFGNRLATALIRAQTGHRYIEMGPFRAIRYDSLLRLGMTDLTWGWNVEMQMKAVKHRLRILEVPVRCRPRIGTSKISGTISGVVRAGSKIVWACYKYR